MGNCTSKREGYGEPGKACVPPQMPPSPSSARLSAGTTTPIVVGVGASTGPPTATDVGGATATAARIAELRVAKAAAVEAEEYVEAQRLKEAISELLAAEAGSTGADGDGSSRRKSDARRASFAAQGRVFGESLSEGNSSTASIPPPIALAPIGVVSFGESPQGRRPSRAAPLGVHTGALRTPPPGGSHRRVLSGGQSTHSSGPPTRTPPHGGSDSFHSTRSIPSTLHSSSHSLHEHEAEHERTQRVEAETNFAKVWALGLFSHHTKHRVRRLIRKCQRVYYHPGAAVVTQGQPNLHFYVIVAGEARVEQDGVRRPFLLGPGDCLGHHSLMGGVDSTLGAAGHTPGNAGSSRLLGEAGDNNSGLGYATYVRRGILCLFGWLLLLLLLLLLFVVSHQC